MRLRQTRSGSIRWLERLGVRPAGGTIWARPAIWLGSLVAAAGWGAVLITPLLASLGPPAGAFEIARAIHIMLIFGGSAVATGVAVVIVDAVRLAIERLDRLPATPSMSAARRSIPASPMPAPTRVVVARQRIGDRHCVLFDDGSVTVETLFGLRRFGSVAEACEFIGADHQPVRLHS